MRKLTTFLIAILFFLTGGCGAAPSTPQTPAEHTRASARAAVDVAKDAWLVVAQSCIDVAAFSNDHALLDKCQAVLKPAAEVITLAANAVDTVWSPVAACALAQAVDQVGGAVLLLGPMGKDVTPVVQDALVVAHLMLGTTQCVAPTVADAGSPAAPDAGKE